MFNFIYFSRIAEYHSADVYLLIIFLIFLKINKFILDIIIRLSPSSPFSFNFFRKNFLPLNTEYSISIQTCVCVNLCLCFMTVWKLVSVTLCLAQSHFKSRLLINTWGTRAIIVNIER